jgi:ribose 5-phosphate isomerase A
LLREKLVWEASTRCVTIADAAKVGPVLGAFALPIEVVTFGAKATQRRICDVLAEFEIYGLPKLRQKDGQPFRTDQGNLIYDVPCGRIDDATALADAIKSLTGVVDHGLFLDLADEALVGTDTGVDVLQP